MHSSEALTQPGLCRGSRTFENAVKSLPTSHIRDALLSSLTESGNDLDKLRTSIATWFDDSMERLSGAYKRQLKWISMLIGMGPPELGFEMVQTVLAHPREEVVGIGMDHSAVRAVSTNWGQTRMNQAAPRLGRTQRSGPPTAQALCAVPRVFHCGAQAHWERAASSVQTLY